MTGNAVESMVGYWNRSYMIQQRYQGRTPIPYLSATANP